TLPRMPHVFVTVHHNVLDKKRDAATVWVEDVTRDGFTVCTREGRTFDGRHKDIDVTWMAMTEVPQTWNYHDFVAIDFPNTLLPNEADNDAFCQIVDFKEPYYSPPSIVLAPSHVYDSSNVNSVRPEHNSIAAWIEETTHTYFKTCVKDFVGLNNKHHPIRVDYLVFGVVVICLSLSLSPDLDPCINKTCEYFGICQAMSSSQSQCVCLTHCPSYQDLVCATNGQTFDNMCVMKRYICRTMGNYSYYHPGGCQGFPLDKGRQYLSHVSSFAESHCEVVSLKPYTFYPDKPVHVQLTVNYINTSLPAKVHDATVTWTEKVSTDNFTACITKTGRDDKQTNDITSVDWIAYQGAPNGGVTGKERFTQWWTGTKCRTLSLPSFVSENYRTLMVLIHEEIDVDWMAFETLHRPLFSEHDSVYFANDYTPLKSDNYAFCKVIVIYYVTCISSQEENTYVQHRHGGDTGWIGFQDIHSEGNFTWIDGTPKSCSHAKSLGYHESKHYVIDPDGPNGAAQPFSVYCNMTSHNGIGVTVYIKYECVDALLLYHRVDAQTSWLVSRDGRQMKYWGGASRDSGMCACGMTGSCASNASCNCDANKDFWLEDSGLLNYKEDLPVISLRFGDVGDVPDELGYHTLGKLRCYGQT
ncbi:hypothetical protein QZH41_008568, partial [Actinostola sp. cb2023]